MSKPAIVQHFNKPAAWQALKQFTNARIATGRAGSALPLAENLLFKADHAYARDAVFTPLDTDELARQLYEFNLPVYRLHSRAKNRVEYLQRPDKGRQLNDDSAASISGHPPCDIAFIIADGLSAKAVELYTMPVLQQLLPLCYGAGYNLAPFCIIRQGRVAIGDEAGMLLRAKVSTILIGERPGLSSPHSMGIYITYNPVTGLTDESRYCISNIHAAGGLTPPAAAAQAFALIQASLAAKLSGVYAKHQRQLPG